MEDNIWPSVPDDLKLSAVNCVQRMQSYFNYEKRLCL